VSRTGAGGWRWSAGLLLRPLAEAERDEVLADLGELREHRRRSHRRAVATLWYGWALIRFAWTLRARRHLFGTGSRSPGTATGETSRTGGLSSLLASVGQDIRQALRGLVRMPGVTLVAIPTLALAIGTSTALFSFADALMLRPLPVPEPDRLLALYHQSTKDPGYYGSFSYPDYLEIRDARNGLSGVAAYGDLQVHLGDGPEAEPVEGAIVSANYFSVLGVRPLVGRGFVPEDDQGEGAHPVVVLAEDLWTSRFGGDPSVVGRQMTLNGRPFTVVGIAPRATPGPDLHEAPELWVPLMTHQVVLPSFRIRGLDLFSNRGTQWLDLVARLDPRATRARVDGALESLARRQAVESPDDEGWTIAAVPLGSARTGYPGSSPVPRLTALLAAVVAMVLLIACANVANLLLVRGTVRRREMAVRVAIGAGRARLVRQVLTEALLLALAGGAGGVLLATWALNALPSLGVTADLPALDVRLDARVLGFALALALVSALVAGVVPALRASTVDAVRAGRASGASDVPGRSRLPLHQSLVAVQVALSLILLVGAGLTLRTLRNLYALPLGFDLADVRVAEVDPPEEDSSAAAERRLYAQLLRGVRAVAGVRAASLAEVSPFSHRRMANDVSWETGGLGGSRARLNVDVNVVGTDYFRTLGIRLLAGRAFTGQDAPGGRPVAIVNQALAARLWPGESPLGKRVWYWNPWRPDTPGDPMEVVGVVSDGRYYRAWRSAGRPFLFLPFAQHPTKAMYLHVRGAAAGIPAERALRRAVADVEPAPSLGRMETVREARAQSVATQRASAKLLTLFGLLAGAIAAIGIYGVVSFTVGRRTHEIGVRMALGARARDVRRHVLAGSALPVLVGTAVGWLAALALSRYLSSLLYGIGPRDPVTFAGVGAALVGIGLAASLVPARRATRVDPLRALREE
jgi:predicted permease